MKHFYGKHGGQGGFTMIEIIAVLVIIGIIAAVAIARMSSTKEYDLASQAEVVKAHLRQAQNRAMNANEICGKACGIKFTESEYFLFKNGSATEANKLRLLGEDAKDVVLPNGMTITTGTVTFDAWGRPYTNEDATSALSSELALSLSKGADSRVIKITPYTGFVE